MQPTIIQKVGGQLVNYAGLHLPLDHQVYLIIQLELQMMVLCMNMKLMSLLEKGQQVRLL